MYVSRLRLVRLFKDILADAVDHISQLGLLWTKADITGSITKIDPGAKKNILAEIFVESRIGKYTGRSVVSVKHETALFQKDGKKIQRVTFQMLRAGQEVQVWFPSLVFAPLFGSGMAQEILIVK
jgi:hypothetical protein